MEAVNKLKKMGYEVEESFSSEDIPTVYCVSGFGISVHVAENDSEAWKALLNREAHDERVYQYENPNEDHTARLLKKEKVK